MMTAGWPHSYLLFVLDMFCTASLCHLVVITRWNPHAPSEHLASAPQNRHFGHVPRVGGAAIFAVFLLQSLFLDRDDATGLTAGYKLLLVASLPVFVAGLIEDITGRITPKVRFGASVLSAILSFYLLDARIIRSDIPFVDPLLDQFTLVSLVVTAFAVAGIAHSINIVDGCNGLASLVSVIILAALCYVSHRVGDSALVFVSLTLIASVLGFFLLNYPYGLIFLGDGGAYFIGFIISQVAILLVIRHPEVSAWFPFLLCFYPTFETVFSIYRRFSISKRSPMEADALHLHSLIMSRVVMNNPKLTHRENKLRKNYLTSPYLWFFNGVVAMVAIWFYDSPLVLMGFYVVFIVIYIWVYSGIVNFRIRGSSVR